jgi:hypothetical protein
MRYWRLTETDIITALESPDSITPSIKARSNAWKQTDAYRLQVPFVEEDGLIVVITVGLPGRFRRPPKEE